MKVWKDENVKALTTTVYIQSKKVIDKIVFDSQGNKLKEELTYCYCPACKHLAGCSVSQMWYCKQLGRCRYFETE